MDDEGLCGDTADKKLRERLRNCSRSLNSKTDDQNERKVMNNKFDELAKGLAQSVTRRQALKRLSVGLAGMALGCFGLANKAHAGKGCTPPDWCDQLLNPCCCGGPFHRTNLPKACPDYLACSYACNPMK